MGISELKSAHGAKTSEDLFGIGTQPPPQCPYLDRIIEKQCAEARNAKDSEQELKRMQLDGTEGVETTLDWVDFNLREMYKDVDEVRQSIVDLRSWGDQWKSIAHDLIKYAPEEELAKLIPGYQPQQLTSTNN